MMVSEWGWSFREKYGITVYSNTKLVILVDDVQRFLQIGDNRWTMVPIDDFIVHISDIRRFLYTEDG